MEKIYIEDNNSSKHDKNYRSTYRISIVLSFVVAAFALVSIVAFGFNQVSFAAGGVISDDKFNLKLYNPVIASSESGNFNIPVYFAKLSNGEERLVFCVQGGIEETGDEYTKGNEMNDVGLMYILSQSSLHGGPGIISSSITDEKTKYTEIAATQMAVWIYLNEKYPQAAEHALTRQTRVDDPESIVSSEVNVNILKTANSFTVNDGSSDGLTVYSENMYQNGVKNVVAKAHTHVNQKYLKINFDPNNISEVEGSNYYQTSVVSVTPTPSDDLESYEVKLDDGLIAVDEKGEQIKNLSSLSASDKFFVRIPKDKITEETHTFSITVNGTFKNFLTGTEYLSSGKQTVIAVTSEKHVFSDGVQFDVVGSPDTGMSTSQTIYFIGLIVLLCGVGIIYANAKPIKNL